MSLKQQVFELRSQGLNAMQIARKLNQSPHIIHRILKSKKK